MCTFQLLYQSDLPISSAANSHSIPRSRLSSFYGRLRRKLKLPVQRNTFRLVIIPDIPQKEVIGLYIYGLLFFHFSFQIFVEKASLKEVEKLVKKVY